MLGGDGGQRWLNGGKSQIYTDAHIQAWMGEAVKKDEIEICEDITVSSRDGFIEIIYSTGLFKGKR